MIKKIVITVLLICVCCTMCFTLIGCIHKLPRYESGDYVYAVNTLKDGTKEAYIIGLTAQGSKQKYLVLPSEIDGISVTQIGYFQSTGITGYYVPGSSNELSEVKAERLYISEKCISIKKERGIFADVFDYTVLQFFSDSFFESEIRSWMPSSENIIAPLITLPFEAPEGIYPFPGRKAWSYNNVSYMYNYANATDGGYYWIDSWDNTLIDFIPPEPIREGYNFDGWYKDEGCTEIWDFNTDKTGDIIIYSDSKDIDTSSEIFLYAKWIED